MDLERSVTPWIAIATFLLALLAAVSLKAWEEGLFESFFEDKQPRSLREQSHSGIGLAGGGPGPLRLTLGEPRMPALRRP